MIEVYLGGRYIREGAGGRLLYSMKANSTRCLAHLLPPLRLVIFPLLCAALAKLVFPPAGSPSEDFLDDLSALYRWLEAHAAFTGFLFRGIEKAGSALVNISWGRRLINWLNPRKHPWHFVILAGLGMGLVLALAEAGAEGLPQARLILLVFGVFLGVEGAGVLLGYALFRRFLGIFRAGETL